MSMKKKNYTQGEMRPLSALQEMNPAPKREPKPKADPSGMNNSVSTLAKQQKQEEVPVHKPAVLEVQAEYSEAEKPAVLVKNSQGETFTEEDKRELLSEMNITEVPPKRTVRRRGAAAPDLTDKASRDAYFSRYISTPSEKKMTKAVPEPVQADEAQAILQEEAKKRAERERLNRVPFSGPLTRPVVSHMKEDEDVSETAASPAEADVSDEEVQATAEMREAIEGMMRKQREERENAREDAEVQQEMKKTTRNWDIVQIALVVGILVICAVKMLFK